MGLTKVSTDGVKDDAITKTKIPANQIEASELADNAVDTNAIADQAVALSKLPHGTSSNDGKFLRANNGADPSFETITGTTINNNADNRVITGSGTANTLEGESNLTFNGTKLSLTPPANTGNDGLEIIPAGGSTASSFKVRGNQSAGVAAGRNGGVVEIDANYYVATSDIFTIKSRGSTVLNMYGNGNVGLGVTNPTTLLHLKVNQQTAKMITLNGDDTRNNYIGINGGDNLEIAADEDAAGSSSSIRFRVDGTERMRMDSDGLKFNGDTAAANALDDYEEGTWTPVLNASSYSLSQDMFYTKIGRVVFVSGALEFTSITGGSGVIEITGLPFTNINSNDAFTTISAHAYESLNVGNTSYQFQTLRINKGSAIIKIIIPTGNANIRTFGNYSHVGNSRFAFRVAGYYITG